MVLKKLLKNSFFYTVAGMLPQLINFLLMPVYTRFLTPEDYAILALVTVFTSLVGLIITFQIQGGVSRLIISFIGDERRSKRYFGGITILVVAILFAGGIILELWGDFILSICYKNENLSYRPLFQVGIWTIILTALQSVFQALVRVQEKAEIFLRINVVVMIVGTVIGLIVVVKYEMGIMGVLYSNLISAVVGLLLYLIMIRDWLCWAFPYKDIIDSIKFSIPLVPHAIAGFVFIYSDRIILEKHVPLASIGVYVIADRFAMIMKLLVNSFNDAYAPHFIKRADADPIKAREETKQLIRWWWAFILWIFFGFILFSKEIVILLTGEGFHEAAGMIPLLASAYVFRGLYCFSINGIFLMRQNWAVPLVTVVAGAVNVVVNIIYVPKYGVYGSIWATIAAFFISFVLSYAFSFYIFKICYPWRMMIYSTLFLGVFIATRVLINSVLTTEMIWQLAVDVVFFLCYGLCSYFMAGNMNSVKTIFGKRELRRTEI